MPLTLAAAEVRDLLARIGEHDLDAPGEIEAALEWLDPREGGASAQPFRISRYRLLLLLWYGLPRKWLIDVEEMRDVAARLGRFFDLAGREAAPYADACRSAEVAEMIAAWDRDPAQASERLAQLLEATGIEPPDTELLRWASLMGPDETVVRELVALRLEEAIEAEELSPGTRGFKRAQAGFVAAVLGQPAPWREGGAGAAPTALELIERERLARWQALGTSPRSEIVAEVAPLLEGAPDRPLGEWPEGEGEGPTPLEPLRWLLEQAAPAPIALTQTGALNRALVRAAAERFPSWWNAEIHGPPHRELDVARLGTIHRLARRLRLLRRRGRALRLTGRGRELLAERAALAEACARELLAGEPFEAELGELQLAYLLPRPGPVERSEMDELTWAAMREGWRSSAGPLELVDVHGGADGLLAVADALGLIERSFEFDRETLESRRELLILEPARPLLLRALRLRALGPVHGP